MFRLSLHCYGFMGQYRNRRYIPKLSLLANKKAMENWAGPGNEASTELLQYVHVLRLAHVIVVCMRLESCFNHLHVLKKFLMTMDEQN